METVTISPKYQVVIPKSVREQLGLVPGQQVQMIAHGHHIEVVPIVPIKQMRGFLAGIDTSVPSEEDRL